ncbi:FAD-dependent pyridine nucleotide-disulfide oxidoreductase [Mycobacteroides abscessus subsp. abscessus]|nr:FAD-dependent pyridine nucleotide-disulfide oxidoreductase [Mycobacteroides abscessus subsp. abscessus]
MQRLSRAAIYAARETQVVGLAKFPPLMQAFELISKAKLRSPRTTASAASAC